MQHIAHLLDADHLDKAKGLVTRALGRFYTPDIIGRQLAKQVVDAVVVGGHIPATIIDPFCGDGRLIEWLLDELVRRNKLPPQELRIELWDCDTSALTGAVKRVKRCVTELGINAQVKPRSGDTFDIAPSHFGRWDVVITNPPWEVLKPDRRELVGLAKKEVNQFVTKLQERSQILEQRYPYSRPKRRFSGWGYNLARGGLELSLKLLSRSGVCGIVLPASFMADDISGRLREWTFTTYSSLNINFYPAESRLFADVDQPVITLVNTAVSQVRRRTRLTILDKAGATRIQSKVAIDISRFASDEFVLPVLFGSGPLKMLPEFSSLPRFADLEMSSTAPLWAGRELDETGYQTFLDTEGSYRFVKGRMVTRFGMTDMPDVYVRDDGPRIPVSANNNRIAWRDVSRPTQKRRMQGTIIPAGWVTGNSLSVAYFHDNNLSRLHALLGVMNSLVFEYQVRAYLATAHVSLSTVRRTRVPVLNSSTIRSIKSSVRRCLDGIPEATWELEVLVAKKYGLSRDEFAEVLSGFPKLSDFEVSQLLDRKLWSLLS